MVSNLAIIEEELTARLGLLWELKIVVDQNFEPANDNGVPTAEVAKLVLEHAGFQFSPWLARDVEHAAILSGFVEIKRFNHVRRYQGMKRRDAA
jgi:hypothetical protein